MKGASWGSLCNYLHHCHHDQHLDFGVHSLDSPFLLYNINVAQMIYSVQTTIPDFYLAFKGLSVLF